MSFRSKRRGLHAAFTACAVTVGVLAGTAESASAFVPCPSGGNRAGSISEWTTTWPPNERTDPKGVTMCLGEEGIWGTDKGWLQMVDLGDGARIRLPTQVDPSSRYGLWNYGLLGEPYTLYTKRTAEDWYAWLRNYDPENPAYEFSYEFPPSTRLFSVTTASFFKDDNNERPTRLPFPFLFFEHHDSFGMSSVLRDEDYAAEKKSLEIGSPTSYGEEEAEINQTVRLEGFPARYTSSDVVTKLQYEGRTIGDPEEWGIIDGLVSFAPWYRVGESNRRNYLGVYGDTVYIFTSDALYTNEQAYEIMREIQPGMDVIQLDGGGSAQLYSEYGEMDSSIPIFNREVPNVLAIYRAP